MIRGKQSGDGGRTLGQSGAAIPMAATTSTRTSALLPPTQHCHSCYKEDFLHISRNEDVMWLAYPSPENPFMLGTARPLHLRSSPPGTRRASQSGFEFHLVDLIRQDFVTYEYFSLCTSLELAGTSIDQVSLHRRQENLQNSIVSLRIWCDSCLTHHDST